MKIFVSYSRRDAGDFANQIQIHLSAFDYEIFTDFNGIRGGDIWSETIEENISKCDIFVVIVTYGALHSEHVEKEVLQAQNENKKMIPCFHKSVIVNDIKWGLEKIQGVEFTNEYQLARDLHSKIAFYNSSGKKRGGVVDSISKDIEEKKAHAPITPIKSEANRLEQTKDTLLPSSLRTGAIGSSSEIPPHSKFTASESYNNERIYIERDRNRPLKLLIITIIAVAIIGLVIFLNYFNGMSSDSNKLTITQSTTNTTEKVPTTSSPSSNGVLSETTSPSVICETNYHFDTSLKKCIPDLEPNITSQTIPPLEPKINYTKSQQIYKFVNFLGNYDTENGQLNQPYDVAIDSSTDYIYVSDMKNNRILKFDSSGNLLKKWGSFGTNNDEFHLPRGISVDSSGNVYVADYYNGAIKKFDSNGKFITKWGDDGSKEGYYDDPRGVFIDSEDNVYVVDTSNNRIQKFDNSGNLITTWGSKGTGEGQFNTPYDIAVDFSRGYMYIVDTGNNRIQKFDSDGNFITTWGSKGTGEGDFDSPRGISVDSSGNVYVVDTGNNRIQKFDSDGNFITKWGGKGTGEGQFNLPIGISVDSSNYIYVTDTGNNRIQVYAPAT